VYDAGVIGRRAALASMALGCASCFATTGAPEAAHAFPVRTYTLPSGMRLVVEQDDGSKLVGVAWTIDVGDADDPPGRSGLAHLVEHLLFRLPDASGVSTWRRLIDLGASSNAMTSVDLTTAYGFVPRAALDELVAIFFERMSEPAHGLDEAALQKERRVVDEELALREGSPGLRLAVEALAGRPVIPAPAAMRAALGAISIDDVRSFIAAHYRPERMTLVLSGPLDPDWDRRVLDTLPAGLLGDRGRRVAPARHPLAAATSAAPRPEIASVVGKVSERELWLAWPIAPARGKDQVPMRMVAALADRILARKIESFEIADVSAGNVTVFSSAAVAAVLFRLELRPRADPERVRGEAGDLLQLLRTLPIADWQRAERRRVELDLQATRLREALAMESLAVRTRGRALIAHDDPQQGAADLVSAVIATSLNGVADVIARDLSDPPARSILLTPAAGVGPGPSRARAPVPAAEPGDVDERLDDEDGTVPHDAQAVIATAQGLGAREARVSRLRNGLTLIVLPRRGLPVATMLLGFHADPRPDERPGLRPALSIARSFRLALGPLERAILQRSFVDADEYFDTLEMFSSSAKSAIDLLWDEAGTLQVDWPSPAGELWAQRAARREATADGQLATSFTTALFGAHPYRLDQRSESVRRAKAAELRTWIEQVRRPANGALVVVGDVDATAIAADVEDALSDWSADESPAPPPPAPPKIGVARPVPLLAAVDSSRAWTKLEFACFLPPATSARDGVVGELLTDVLEDELFRRLRVERAASYSPHLSRAVLRGGTHLLEGALDVEPSAGPAAREILRGWLDPASVAAFDAAAIETARWRVARRSGLASATNGALAGRLYQAWNMGWPLESLDDYPRDLASVTPAEVANALAACRASAVISSLAPP
jgi:zinc protease